MNKLTLSHEEAEAVAPIVLSEWQAAHGSTDAQARVLVGSDSVAVLIENAFARVEQHLAARSDSNNPIHRYLEGLLDEVRVKGQAYLEAVTSCQVAISGKSLNIEEGWVMCIFKLGEPSQADHPILVTNAAPRRRRRESVRTVDVRHLPHNGGSKSKT